MGRIARTFEHLSRAGRTALMPFITVGFPAAESTLAIVPALAAAGADMIELGVPFSDPLADGPTIQAAGQRALANGVTLRGCLDTAERLRDQGLEIPLILMGYYNPIFQFGIEAFTERAAAAGVDGVIIPDLPPEESDELRAALAACGLDLIFFLTPVSDDERIELVAERATGFIYLISLTGVTGARDHLPPELENFVSRVRTRSSQSLCVGFGIGTPAEAARVGRIADGVIVGSALIKRVAAADDPVAAAAAFISDLRAGLDGAS
ncbi:MAG: tryptophan synthase subunit alpha [Ardenticatenaceae bacterium]|nr:tryptophan synthase subunit alpha [Ardenticatenaceae bacterium]